MDNQKVAKFMALAGQVAAEDFTSGNEAQRKLGAQLLLSEVLEYVIKGLGVIPEVEGVKISDPDAVQYHTAQPPSESEMLDGLADVAYTMYWNACAFGLPLEDAYDLVCDNNLEKFVKLGDWARGKKELEREHWNCGRDIEWPPEVVRVEVIQFKNECYAAGKDARGKVRKPGSFRPVDLTPLLTASA